MKYIGLATSIEEVTKTPLSRTNFNDGQVETEDYSHSDTETDVSFYSVIEDEDGANSNDTTELEAEKNTSDPQNTSSLISDNRSIRFFETSPALRQMNC